MFILGACVFLFFLVFLALLWFFATPEGTSLFSRLHRFFFASFPRRCLLLLEKTCGTRARRGVERAFFYVCHTNNPLVQIVYLAVMIGGYSQVVLVGYPWIPNAYLGAHHKFIAFGVFIACLATFLVCSLKDPGVIDHSNVDEHVRLYPYDKCIYFPDSKCSTCLFTKPARSKHCRLCNVCVARFDHHCVWIGNCVGARNHGAFIVFLVTHFLMCAYGSVTSLSLLMGIVDALRLTSATYIDPLTGRRSSATWSIVFQYMAGRFGSLIFLAVLFIVFFFLLLGFTAFHIYTAVWRNSTTNECFKYRCMRQVLASPFPLVDGSEDPALSATGNTEANAAEEGREEVNDGKKGMQKSGEPCGEEGAQGSDRDNSGHEKKNDKDALHPALMSPTQAAKHVKKARAKYSRSFLDSLLEVFSFDEWMRETLRREDREFERTAAAAAQATQAVVEAMPQEDQTEETETKEKVLGGGRKEKSAEIRRVMHPRGRAVQAQ
uniref:Palmitoyltransferase n=1 Tax=Neospora caninum (strain Liverpool) TaxID=572307 RepID=A0A0F7UET2_NEOCL|nr:TPA: DHHC zinc finger domain-containing protein [Neospora caninum Liverpool]